MVTFTGCSGHNGIKAETTPEINFYSFVLLHVSQAEFSCSSMGAHNGLRHIGAEFFSLLVSASIFITL